LDFLPVLDLLHVLELMELVIIKQEFVHVNQVGLGKLVKFYIALELHNVVDVVLALFPTLEILPVPAIQVGPA